MKFCTVMGKIAGLHGIKPDIIILMVCKMYIKRTVCIIEVKNEEQRHILFHRHNRWPAKWI